MLTIKNALAYVWRKKIKTLIIFLILLAISTLTLGSIAVKNATDAASKETFKNITSSFSMQINREVNQGTPRGAGNLKGEDIEAVEKVKGISGYIKRMNVVADLIDHQLVKSGETDFESEDRKQKFGRAVMATGINDSSKDDKFTAETFKLVEGRHINKNDKNVALIHKDFAEKNKLKVGDTINIKSNTYDYDNIRKANKTTKVTVIGIFDGKNKGGVSSPQELYENTFITDLETTKTLQGSTDKNAIYQDATFFVNGSQDIDKVMAKVKEISSIDWEAYTLVKSTSNFPALQSSINGIYGVTGNLLIGTLIFGAIVLTLVLFLWINGRRKEMGIMLSMGISKTKIFFQFITEVLFVSIFSFIGAYFAGSAVSKVMGNSILKQVTSGIAEKLAREGKSANLGGGAEVDGFNKTLTSLNVHVSPDDMTKVVIFGLAIIIVSVLIASITLLSKQPKDLLMGDNSK